MNDTQEYVSVKRGFHEAVGFAKEMDRILFGKRNSSETVIDLDKHPFGLEIDAPEDEGIIPRRILFLGYPGYTDVSVLMLGAYAVDAFSSNQKIVYMREIFLETDPLHRSNHAVYFEIMLGNDVYLCGGCSDCSGAGGDGRQRLESLFLLFSQISGVTPEKVAIPYERVGKQVDQLRRMIDGI